MLTIQGAEGLHERHQPLSPGVAHQMPFETDVVIPLVMRTELDAHEEQRLARPCDRIADERAQIGKALPHITGHLLDQRLLQVHDFIMRQRIHESFAVLVHHGEGQLVVRTLPEKGIDLEVVEGVVHPPHVPFQREAQAAFIDWMRHARPRGALLSHRNHAGMQRMHGMIQLLEKGHRFEILTTSEAVAQPLPPLAPVVEVQHRSHRVHAQAIDVELLDPVERVGQQKIAHLIARIIEDVRAPLGVITESWIFVFVAGGTVEAPQCPVVLGEVRRHPVQQHADTRFVHRVHERAKVIGRTMA